MFFSAKITSLPLMILFSSSLAWADCGWNSDRTFYGCQGVGFANSVGRALPLVSDSVRFNPAALPTVPTPIGIESTYSSQTTEGDSKFQISLIKGLPYLGLGLSSWMEDSFATPNGLRYLKERHKENFDEIAVDSRTGFRTGGSLGLPLGSLVAQYAKINVGYSIGRGPKIGGLSKSLGFTVDAGLLSLGYTYTTENLSTAIPKTENTTITGAFTSGPIYLGLTRIKYSIQERSSSGMYSWLYTYETPPFYIASFRVSADQLAFYLAMKTGDSVEANKPTYAGSIQYKLYPNLVLSYIYGLYESQHSASVQLYF